MDDIETSAPNGYVVQQVMATWMSVRARLLENDPALEHDEAALTELLGSAEGDVDSILTRALRAMKYAENLSEAAAAYAKGIQARAKRFEARAETLRGLAFTIMEATGKSRFELPEMLAFTSAGRQTVTVTDAAKVPNVYVEEVTERKIDKAVILKDLRDGRKVEGCELSNGLSYLTVKDR